MRNTPHTPEEYQAAFWAKVNKTPSCWLFEGRKWGSVGSDGYGGFGLHGQKRGAHRLSYEWANGPIPKGMYVLHKCDVPRCVNPSHLFLGTAKDNAQDMVSKGRNPHGVTHTYAKLDDEKVLEMIKLADTDIPRLELARRFGISLRHLYKILSGKSWSHIRKVEQLGEPEA